VQVNARPWALVWINGRPVGATPLRQRLAPGVYDLEAKFPNGRRIQRKIEVAQERRFVSLPSLTRAQTANHRVCHSRRS